MFYGCRKRQISHVTMIPLKIYHTKLYTDRGVAETGSAFVAYTTS